MCVKEVSLKSFNQRQLTANLTISKSHIIFKPKCNQLQSKRTLSTYFIHANSAVGLGIRE